jgi:hypothetical protein
MDFFKRNQYKTVKPGKADKKRNQLVKKVENTMSTLSGSHTTTLMFQAVQLPTNESLEEWIAVHMIQFYNHCNDHYSNIAISGECNDQKCPHMCAGSEFLYLWRDADSELYTKPTQVSATKYARLVFS